MAQKRLLLTTLEDDQRIEIPDKYQRPHHETTFCVKCGFNAKILLTDKGIFCGTCTTVTEWR